ncbi:hypothetical protein ACH4LN_23650 [Streptomyces albus]|nr:MULTISPECIES: hypothetical protein [Streptomyces]KPC73646.1 hypothetical protein ADL27_51920 [Streptomyces sp. NRRL F-6602]EPD95456.1 hypothetical protein HMPREF1486_02245 [Streptomyces sp. HPH0547]MDI6408229.1 hypothetical protein [Streptomyces albus]UVN56684.1 hypothetical protein NR995_20835 [Streptomyces albus]GHJ22120.1 hypothetical protein TPA0909_37340 [Streptomyces albus]
MRMRTLARSVAVGFAVLGLAGAGAGSAAAWPKGHHYNWVHESISKEWKKISVSDDDRIINHSVIFVFGPMQNDD